MVDEKYEQNMLRLLVFVVYAVCTWKLEQIVDIPVQRIGRDRRGEQIIDCVQQYPEPLL